jgi:hypothetical protein
MLRWRQRPRSSWQGRLTPTRPRRFSLRWDYDLVSEFSPPAVVPKPEKTGATTPACVLLDLNLPVPEIEEENSGGSGAVNRPLDALAGGARAFPPLRVDHGGPPRGKSAPGLLPGGPRTHRPRGRPVPPVKEQGGAESSAVDVGVKLSGGDMRIGGECGRPYPLIPIPL